MVFFLNGILSLNGILMAPPGLSTVLPLVLEGPGSARPASRPRDVRQAEGCGWLNEGREALIAGSGGVAHSSSGVLRPAVARAAS